MRRSAAPSQCRKSAIFVPPFLTLPAAKKPCLNKDITSVKISEVIKTDLNFPNKSNRFVSNPSDLLSLISHEKDIEIPSNKERFFSVVWCKFTKKKHKKWEGDAVLIINKKSVILKDLGGKDIGQCSGYKISELESLEDGSTLTVGGKIIEIQGPISAENYYSGKCFHDGSLLVETLVPEKKVTKLKPFRLPIVNQAKTTTASKNHNLPMFDPNQSDALVLPRPSSQHQWKNNVHNLPVIDVVVNPKLSKHLRPHQCRGVVFLYECVMGFKMTNYYGTILADEMGLGKTLQCITIIDTLMHQGPYGGKAIIKDTLIVTPSSLSSNWLKEFEKWLERSSLHVCIVDSQAKAESYCRQTLSKIMIISYEMLVRHIDSVKAVNFNLLVCDEGHRLKNSTTKASSAIRSLGIKRQILLTGTPVQNDLQELFSLIDFVNPGILGTASSFKKIYEDPIVLSQQLPASAEEKELGQFRLNELNKITQMFTLRRTQDIINKYLPPKTEYVVFCNPAPSQMNIYEKIVNILNRKLFIGCDMGDHLQAINILRKLCNHPSLINSKQCEGSEFKNEIINLIPSHLNHTNFFEKDSGKLAVVSCLLWSLSETTKERVVIVSNFTSTLDMLEQLCVRYSYTFLRLDGSTPSSKRMNLVDRFNNKHINQFVFLLSAKAGGVGLNLIGASRIILYDIDWNPATDLQAMARVWRDGQEKCVKIYRLLLTGSLEEKMFQRQVKKQGLSGAVIDSRDSSCTNFSHEELKDLFTFHEDTLCITHEVLKCSCHIKEKVKKENILASDIRECQLGIVGTKKGDQLTTMDQLNQWQHISPPFNEGEIMDSCLESGKDFISFVFKSDVYEAIGKEN